MGCVQSPPADADAEPSADANKTEKNSKSSGKKKAKNGAKKNERQSSKDITIVEGSPDPQRKQQQQQEQANKNTSPNDSVENLSNTSYGITKDPSFHGQLQTIPQEMPLSPNDAPSTQTSPTQQQMEQQIQQNQQNPNQTHQPQQQQLPQQQQQQLQQHHQKHQINQQQAAMQQTPVALAVAAPQRSSYNTNTSNGSGSPVSQQQQQQQIQQSNRPQSHSYSQSNTNTQSQYINNSKGQIPPSKAGHHHPSQKGLQPVPSQSQSSYQSQTVNGIVTRHYSNSGTVTATALSDNDQQINSHRKGSSHNNKNSHDVNTAASAQNTPRHRKHDKSGRKHRGHKHHKQKKGHKSSHSTPANAESEISENEGHLSSGTPNNNGSISASDGSGKNGSTGNTNNGSNANTAGSVSALLDPAIAEALKHSSIEDKARVFKKNKERMSSDRDFIVSKLQPSRFLKLPKNLKSFFPAHHSHCDVRQLFHIRRSLGAGVTGRVYKANYRENTVALKAIKRSKKWGEYLFAQETQLLMSLDHPNVVKLTDIFCDEHYFYMISEMGEIDLADYREDHEFTDQQLRTVIKQILSGVAYLHQNDIAHRDLKPENVVYARNKKYHPLLIDFGDAIHVENDQTYDEFVGTPSYLAPERFNPHKGWELKQSDVWAVGIITYELIVGRHCFDGRDQNSIFAKIKKNKWSWPSDANVTPLCRDFVKKCLHPDPSMRLTALQALTHPWITYDESRRNAEREKRRSRRRRVPKVSIPDASSTITAQPELSPTQSYSQSISVTRPTTTPSPAPNGVAGHQVPNQTQTPQAHSSRHHHSRNSHNGHRSRHRHNKQKQTAQSQNIQATTTPTAKQTATARNKHVGKNITNNNQETKPNINNSNSDNGNKTKSNSKENPVTPNQIPGTAPHLQPNTSNASDPGINPGTNGASSVPYTAVNDESDTEYQQARQFFNTKHLSFSAQSVSIGSPSAKGNAPTSQFLSPVLHNRNQSNQSSYSQQSATNAYAAAGAAAGHRRPRAYSEHKTKIPSSIIQAGATRQSSHGGQLTGPNTPQHHGYHGNDKLPNFGQLAFSNSSISAVSVASSVSLSARLSNPDLVSLFSKLAPTVPGTRFQHLLASGYKQSMTEAGIAAARKEFDLMDRDKDGYIGTDDLINVFTEHENMSPNEAAAIARIIIDQLDISKNNKISFDEFVQSKVTRSFSRSAYELFDELLQNTRSYSANAGVLDGTTPPKNNKIVLGGGNIDETYLASDYDDDHGTDMEMQYNTDYATDDNGDANMDEKLSASPNGMAPIHETAHENSTSQSGLDETKENKENTNNSNNGTNGNVSQKRKNQSKKQAGASTSIGATLPVIDSTKQSNASRNNITPIVTSPTVSKQGGNLTVSTPVGYEQAGQTPSMTMSVSVSNSYKMHDQQLTLEHLIESPAVKKLNLTDDLIKQIFAEIDKNKTGKITFQQFYNAVVNQPITDVIVDVI